MRGIGLHGRMCERELDKPKPVHVEWRWMSLYRR